MSNDPRTFHALQFFGTLSTESIRALAIDGGYMALAAKYADKCRQVEGLRVELERVNAKAQRVLERLPR